MKKTFNLRKYIKAVSLEEITNKSITPTMMGEYSEHAERNVIVHRIIQGFEAHTVFDIDGRQKPGGTIPIGDYSKELIWEDHENIQLTNLTTGIIYIVNEGIYNQAKLKGILTEL
jgi:hypothetical protein